MEAQYLLKTNKVAEAWIALTDLAEHDQYVWSTTGLRVFSTFWAKESWNDKGGEEECITITSEHQHPENWFDRVCKREYHFICQEITTKKDNNSIDVRVSSNKVA